MVPLGVPQHKAEGDDRKEVGHVKTVRHDIHEPGIGLRAPGTLQGKRGERSAGEGFLPQDEIRDVQTAHPQNQGQSADGFIGHDQQEEGGEVEEEDIIPRYINHVLSFVEIDKIEPFKVVVDAGNGMAGKIIPITEVYNETTINR